MSAKVEITLVEQGGKSVWMANIWVHGKRYRRNLGAASEFDGMPNEERDRILQERRESNRKKIEASYDPDELSRDILKKFYPVKIEQEAKIKAEILAENYRTMRSYLFQQAGVIKELNKRVEQTPVVYVVQSDEYFKIGSTCSYDQRMYNIQTSNPRSILIRGLIPTATLQQARYLEHELQETFMKFRFHANTEWFHGLPEEHLRVNVILMGGLFLDEDHIVRLDNYKEVLDDFDDLYKKIRLPTKREKRSFRDFAKEQKHLNDLSMNI